MLKHFALISVSMFVFAVRGEALSAEKAVPEAVIKVVLENDKVKVQDVQFRPGAVSKTQERPARVVYYLTPAHFARTYPDGKTEDVTRKVGETVWLDTATYEVKNIGKNHVHLLTVQPK